MKGDYDKYDIEEPIAALATPWGESAIAVIRTSGRGVLEILDELFTSGGGKEKKDSKDTKLSKARGYSLIHGYIYDPDFKGESEKREIIDEVMIAIFKAPKSYTGEDAAEIYCHGGLPIIKRILDLLLKRGFRSASPGEFTMRAFLNGKLDLTRAEAVNELIRAKTDTARELAFQRLSGSIEERINEVKGILKRMAASVELQLDYAEDDIDEEPEVIEKELLDDASRVREKLDLLRKSYRTGKLYQEGITIVLAGGTNAGKSTLFNLFLREERAIVSEIHGTTRDYIEGNVTISGIPVRLFDTAGLRRSDDPLEMEGVRRSDRMIREADLIVYLVDGQEGLSKEDQGFLHRRGIEERVIPVWNKSDLLQPGENPPEGFIPISAVTGEGFEKLVEEIENRVLAGVSVKRGEPVIDSLRQKELLDGACRAVEAFGNALKEGQPLDVAAVELNEALGCLGEITGEVTTGEILNSIFSRFCVGK